MTKTMQDILTEKALETLDKATNRTEAIRGLGYAVLVLAHKDASKN